ncbi:MAG: hypothetical protein D4S01_06715, partial [Dehalococcoidia bacterium]
MLLPIHETELTIPEFWVEKGMRIAGNLVRQLGCEQAQGFCQLYEYAKKIGLIKDEGEYISKLWEQGERIAVNITNLVLDSLLMKLA